MQITEFGEHVGDRASCCGLGNLGRLTCQKMGCLRGAGEEGWGSNSKCRKQRKLLELSPRVQRMCAESEDKDINVPHHSPLA